MVFEIFNGFGLFCSLIAMVRNPITIQQCDNSAINSTFH